MGLLSRGQAWLNRTLGTDAGVSILYVQDGDSVTITDARPGRTVFAQTSPINAPAAAIVWGERDYLIPVASLVIAGQARTPRQGDKITETINGQALTFEIKAPAGEPAWRYSDTGRTLFRVHCKRVS